MEYYVVINGESSLDIEGLAIESLPAISKPLMRSKRGEIDGRNGDIITQLGFSAYDKTLKIGLWGNYDIDEIISYFNQDGIISFSNEPDMYYNFTILNRIDFINQLEAFRKATITIHCQPFKYKEEETETLEIEEHQEEGTSFNLEGTIEAPMQIELKGNTSQVQLSGKNIFNPITINNGTAIYTTNCTATQDGELIKLTATDTGTLTFGTGRGAGGAYQDDRGFLMEIKPSTNYSYNIEGSTIDRVYFNAYDENRVSLGGSSRSGNSGTYQTPATAKYMTAAIIISGTNGTTYTLKTIVAEGSEIPTYEQYCGGTPSPNPSYPQDIHNVSGNNEIVVCGKNLCDGTSIASYVSSGGHITADTTNRYISTPNKILVQPNTTYTITFIGYEQYTNMYLSEWNDSNFIGRTSMSGTFTTSPTTNYIYVHIFDSNAPFTQYGTNIQIEKGSTATTYEAYNGTTYNIDLPEGMELNKIGTYQDYIYKENDKWYLHKEIGKVNLEDYEYTKYGASTGYSRNTTTQIPNIKYVRVNTELGVGLCEKYQIHTGKGMSGSDAENHFAIDVSIFQVTIPNNDTPSGLFYYALATPTNTEITDTTLIEKLEAIKTANSYYGTTNINQVNNDMPFILDVSYLSGTNNITITNHGNYYSKPKLTLTGTGNIGIYLNDSQIFQVSLGTNETIIIDTDKMEAYYESTLKNRQVIGDYNSFKLLSGENTIRISGTFSKLQVDNYSRWI